MKQPSGGQPFGASVTLQVTVLRRLGRRIQEVRAERELTQEDLARRVGLSRAYLARLEIGRHNAPILTVARIAKALKVPITDLLA